MLLCPVSRRVNESICCVPLGFPDEIELDNLRSGVVPLEGMVHRPLFPHFWCREHFDKSTAACSFAEGDLTFPRRWLKSSLEDFIARFELERMPDPKYLEDLSNGVPKPRFVDTHLVLQVRDAAHRREILGEGTVFRDPFFYFLPLVCFIVFLVLSAYSRFLLFPIFRILHVFS